MAASNNDFKLNFDQNANLSSLTWKNKPNKFTIGADDVAGLKIWMDAKTDFWQKTYYEPTLVKHNGHMLLREVTEDKVVMETEFVLDIVHQFDQAGLLVLVDSEHWIKTGLEYSDGVCRLGSVVTNTYSDWSTSVYPTTAVMIRIYKLFNDYLIEAKAPDSEEWEVIRICHLHSSREEAVQMGLFACSPTDSGGSATFRYLSCKPTKGHAHTN